MTPLTCWKTAWIPQKHPPETTAVCFPDAVARGDFRAPLVIGDRLDTDIEGANAAGLPSLMVLTGVNTARDAVYAEPARRPTYIGHDLRSLHQDSKLLEVGPQSGWRVDLSDGAATVSTDGDCPSPDGDGLSIVRAVAGADDDARAALRRWSLVQSD